MAFHNFSPSALYVRPLGLSSPCRMHGTIDVMDVHFEIIIYLKISLEIVFFWVLYIRPLSSVDIPVVIQVLISALKL